MTTPRSRPVAVVRAFAFDSLDLDERVECHGLPPCPGDGDLEFGVTTVGARSDLRDVRADRARVAPGATDDGDSSPSRRPDPMPMIVPSANVNRWTRSGRPSGQRASRERGRPAARRAVESAVWRCDGAGFRQGAGLGRRREPDVVHHQREPGGPAAGAAVPRRAERDAGARDAEADCPRDAPRVLVRSRRAVSCRPPASRRSGAVVIGAPSAGPLPSRPDRRPPRWVCRTSQHGCLRAPTAGRRAAQSGSAPSVRPHDAPGRVNPWSRSILVPRVASLRGTSGADTRREPELQQLAGEPADRSFALVRRRPAGLREGSSTSPSGRLPSSRVRRSAVDRSSSAENGMPTPSVSSTASRPAGRARDAAGSR